VILLITIYDISKETGFSPTTVSKAFNNYPDISSKTKQKILDKAKELGYIPNSHARTLITKKSWTIGVLFDEKLNIGIKHPIFSAIIESFKKSIESKGYDLLFISKDIGNTKISYLEHCKIRDIDGVIIISSNFKNREIQELIDSDIPCVLMDEEDDKASTVNSDNLRGCFLAIEYLYSLGHRKIAHIHGSLDTYAGDMRKKGYIKAIEKVGLDIKEDYMVDGGYFTYDGGYKAMETLLSLDDIPTAVFVAGDYMAVGAISAIKEKGLRVPQDISIIGYDDIEICKYITPKLATIRQDTELIGENASTVLINSIGNKSTRSSVIVPVELIRRESCKAVD
jgi:DNA-binding LacI/PurR family transcriptional regulator